MLKIYPSNNYIFILLILLIFLIFLNLIYIIYMNDDFYESYFERAHVFQLLPTSFY